MTREPALSAPTIARLTDIVRLCHRAEAIAARGREWYDSDPDLEVPKLAADSVVLKLGEAVRRLPRASWTSVRATPPGVVRSGCVTASRTSTTRSTTTLCGW